MPLSYSENWLGALPAAGLTPGNLAHELTGGRYILPPHLALLNTALLHAVAGRGRKLLVTMPPRHGKSELVSRFMPAWFLGVWPERDVILASYEARFAASWGRKARDTLTAAVGARVFPREAGLRPDHSAANDWQTVAGGGMVTAGVGGAITGRGADLLIIDDPVKNAAEALSAVHREATWDWYQSTASTRLEPGGVTVLILTRWHLDDLAGRLLQEEPDEWRTVSFPAIAEAEDALGRRPGDPLWPERYPLAELDRIKRRLGSYWWAALYQQTPVARGASMFLRAWFPVIDAAPARWRRRVRFWDLAATASAKADWTVGLLLSEDAETPGLFTIEDVQRIQGTPGEVRALLRNTAAQDGPKTEIVIEQEGGASGKFAIDELVRMLRGYKVKGQPASASKVLRADPAAAQVEAGNIRVVRAPWNAAFFTEAEAFPFGEHDDQIDALSGAFEHLVKPVKRFTAGTQDAQVAS